MSALVVNLFGGPGTGKSTTAAGAFSILKARGVNCEIAREFAKDLVWERSQANLHDQLYVFGVQHHRIWTLLDQVDVVLTDSPLLLSLVYYHGRSQAFRQLVVEEHLATRSLNVFLHRLKAYNPVGRVQTEAEAIEIDDQVLDVLRAQKVSYLNVAADWAAPEHVANFVLERIER